MYGDYKGNTYATLQTAVTGTLAEQNTDVLDYASYVNVKRAEMLPNGYIKVPANILTTSEINNAVDSDNALFTFNNAITGLNTRASSVADLNNLIDSASTDWKSWAGTKTLFHTDAFNVIFTAENDSDGFIEAKDSIIEYANDILQETDSEWQILLGLVDSGDITDSDSVYVRMRDYRQGWENISSHPNFPDFDSADIPSFDTYVSGLERWFIDRYTEYPPVDDIVDDPTYVSDLSAVPNTQDTYVWKGYFKADTTGSYEFSTNYRDDAFGIWFEDAALDPTYENATLYENIINSNSKSVAIDMIAGQYYMVFVWHSNNSGPATLSQPRFSINGGAVDTDLASHWFRKV